MLNEIEITQLEDIIRSYGLTETIRAVAAVCDLNADAEPGGTLARGNWRHNANALRRVTKPLCATSLRNGRDGR